MITNSKIQIEDIYVYHAKLVVGLSVESCRKFPLIVGCSIKSLKEEIIDIPARYLTSPCLAIWEVETPEQCAIRSGSGAWHPTGWEGYIIFALWGDSAFQEQLADTGWVKWRVPWLIGSSTYGLDMQDESIKMKYGNHLNVWEPF